MAAPDDENGWGGPLLLPALGAQGLYYFPFPASPPHVTADERRRAADAAEAGAERALGELTQHLVSWRRPVSFHSGGYHLGRTIASLFGEDAVAPAVSVAGAGPAAPIHDELSSDPSPIVVEPSWLRADVPTPDRLAAESAKFSTLLDDLKTGSGRPVFATAATPATKPTAAPTEQPAAAPAEQSAAAPVNPYLPTEGETPEAWQHRLFDSSQRFAKLAQRDPDRAASLRAQMNEAIEAQPGFRDKLNAYRQNIDPEFYADPEGYVARLGLPPEALKEVPRAQVDIAHPDGGDPIEAFIRSNGNNFIKIAANGKVYDASGLPRGLYHKPPIATLYEHNSAALQQDEARRALESGDRGKVVDFVIANDAMAPAQSAIEIGSRLGTPFVGGPAAPRARGAAEPEDRSAGDGPKDGHRTESHREGNERPEASDSEELGNRRSEQNEGSQADDTIAPIISESPIPEEVFRNQRRQEELVRDQQQQLKDAVKRGGAKEKGASLARQGAKAEEITRNTLAQVRGVRISNNFRIGTGVGSRIDNAVTRGEKTAYVESKLTLSKPNQRMINQLRNAVERARKGDLVILQLARPPTKSEVERLKRALGSSVFDRVKILSSQVDVFEVVSAALR